MMEIATFRRWRRGGGPGCGWHTICRRSLLEWAAWDVPQVEVPSLAKASIAVQARGWVVVDSNV